MSRTRGRLLALLAALVAVVAMAGPPALATVDAPEAPAARTTYHPSWHHVHWHINGYPIPGDRHTAWRGCTGTWSSAHGFCQGEGERHHSEPFRNVVHWNWNNRPLLCDDFHGRDPHVWTHELHVLSYDASGQWICGWVDRHWGTFRIVDGQFRDGSGRLRPVHASSAVVADREHTQGGPLFVFLGHRDGGYVLGMRGWVRY
jgi:hypothetical protein